MPITVRPGQPHPLGAHLRGDGVNVAVYSSVAEEVFLCLFDKAGGETQLSLPGMDAGVWHGFVGGVEPGHDYDAVVKAVNEGDEKIIKAAAT